MLPANSDAGVRGGLDPRLDDGGGVGGDPRRGARHARPEHGLVDADRTLGCVRPAVHFRYVVEAQPGKGVEVFEICYRLMPRSL